MTAYELRISDWSSDVCSSDLEALNRVVGQLPGGGEARAGQLEMAEAIAAGIANQRHIAVQAGTGAGKTLAYLVPAVLGRKKTIVATATKALHDQLALQDLPFLERPLERPFTWAIQKGRSHNLCMQPLSAL